MKRVAIVLTLLAGAACASGPIPRDEACREQAEALCAAYGHTDSENRACLAWYGHACGADQGGEIDPDDQCACLDAVDAMTAPELEPAECVSLWAPDATCLADTTCRSIARRR